MTQKLRIGFVDVELEKAHASLLLEKLRNLNHPVTADVVACTALSSENGREWAKEKGVPYYESAEAMAGEIDAVVIPASSRADLHRVLFETSLVCRVPVFIDKPLAPTAGEGLEILRLARENGIALLSASALRFADEVAELRQLPPPDLVQTWGGWSERYDEFLIHPIEVAMTLMGPEVQSVSRFERCGISRIALDYGGGRGAEISFSRARQPYEVIASRADAWHHRKITSPFFDRLAESLGAMFCCGTPPLAAGETLAVLKVMDAARRSQGGEVVPIRWSAEERSFL